MSGCHWPRQAGGPKVSGGRHAEPPPASSVNASHLKTCRATVRRTATQGRRIVTLDAAERCGPRDLHLPVATNPGLSELGGLRTRQTGGMGRRGTGRCVVPTDFRRHTAVTSSLGMVDQPAGWTTHIPVVPGLWGTDTRCGRGPLLARGICAPPAPSLPNTAQLPRRTEVAGRARQTRRKTHLDRTHPYCQVTMPKGPGRPSV